MGIFDPCFDIEDERYAWTDKHIISMHNGFWTSEKFSFVKDVNNFKYDINDQEREIIQKTISAISLIEYSVKTFWLKLPLVLNHPKIADMAITFASVETIHSRAYRKLLDCLGLTSLFKEYKAVEPMKGRAEYLKKYTEKVYDSDKKQFLYSLILFTLFMENTALFSQFYIINWFYRYKNVFIELANQISYTFREEMVHALGGIDLINTIRKEYPELFDDEFKDRIKKKLVEAVEHECSIIDWVIGDYSGERINAKIVKEFIRSQMNDSCHQIGMKKPFHINADLARDFQWMVEEMYANNKPDFFHTESTNYQKNRRVTADDLF